MTSIRMPQGHSESSAPRVSSGTQLRRILLACGILASLLYAAMLVVTPMQWPGYSSAAQTVSELSAIGAPTRTLWVSLGMIWTVLVIAFGLGIRASADGNRALSVAGVLMVASAVFGLAWPPMHPREVLAAGGETLTDNLHVVWTIVTGLFTLLAMGFAAGAFGRRFRLYTIATIVIVVAFGVLTGMDVPRMESDLPTPWMGVWERINIGANLLWVAVLSLALLRRSLSTMQPSLP